MAIRATVWKSILKRRRPVLEKLDRVRKWENLSNDDLQRLQRDRLESILQHSYENVPYFQDQFDTSPEANDLNELPLIDKKTLQNNFDELKSNDIHTRDWYTNSSSGSTGQPSSFVQDTEYRSMNSAIQYLFDSWGGREISEPKIKLWGSEEDMLDGATIKTKVGRWLRNVTWINAYTLTEEKLQNTVETINEVKPKTIHAYVEVAARLAEYIEDNNISVHSPTSVMTTAGTLQPEMREQITRVFNCRVHNRYGSREFGTIASECQCQNSLHFCPATHYIEIIDPDTLNPVEPGEVGEIVVSSLTNYSMPLIRFRIGDMGSISQEECSCGCEWPMISDVQGRVTDHFITESGELVFPAALRKSLYDLEWVDKYQIHQTDTDRVVFRIASQTDPLESDLDAIRQRAKRVLGENTTVEFEISNDIERLDSGKFRHSISDVV